MIAFEFHGARERLDPSQKKEEEKYMVIITWINNRFMFDVLTKRPKYRNHTGPVSLLVKDTRLKQRMWPPVPWCLLRLHAHLLSFWHNLPYGAMQDLKLDSPSSPLLSALCWNYFSASPSYSSHAFGVHTQESGYCAVSIRSTV